MKTITIPKRFGYPTVEIISNGNHYTLKSGEEITVEDHLAEIIENAITLAPKYGKNISKLAQCVDGSITEITLSDLEGIKTIVSYAFRDYRSLTKVIIPDSVTSIGKWAFSNCVLLPSINIPNGVTVISEGTFYGCNKLTLVEIPDTVISIADNAFTMCAIMEKVYLPETPPSLANVNVFSNINAACVFYCKTQASLDAYKKATHWSTLTNTYSFVVEENKNG